jgi:protein-tyrosine phosphatase
VRSIIQRTHDLDNLSIRDVIDQLNALLGAEAVAKFRKAYIDETIMVIVGQQEPPSLMLGDWLYLGSEYNASNIAELQHLGVTHVINVTPDTEIRNFFPDLLAYHRIPVVDVETEDLHRYLADAVRRLSASKEQGHKVLIHCQRGVSRSPTVVVAFLMYDQGLSLQQALQQAKERRSIVKPNKGFLRQLEELELDLKQDPLLRHLSGGASPVRRTSKDREP